MSEESTTTSEAPVTKTPKVKKAIKKSTKPVKAKARTAAINGKDRSMADVPAAERRDALVKLLRKMGATSSGAARPISVLADKLGYGRYDVYCLVYHKFPLARDGYVKLADVEGHSESCVYLTAKGVKHLPSE